MRSRFSRRAVSIRLFKVNMWSCVKLFVVFVPFMERLSGGARFTHRIFLIGAALVFCGVFLFTGCVANQGSHTVSPPSQAVVITTQPLSQTVPIGRKATFTVTATGTEPLIYQWRKNGVEISGATASSYTMPVVAFSDSGSSFQVVVSNASSTATSSTVALTAGARAPALGDLRYLLWQQVTIPWNNIGEPGYIGIQNESITNALGTPLQIGSAWVKSENSCTFMFNYALLPPTMTGLNMYYAWSNTRDVPYESYLNSIVNRSAVITSIDLENACNIVGVSWVQTTQNGEFDYKIETVSPAQIQATIAADGAESRIVTAVTFDDTSGNAILISYGWQEDTTTEYEAKTVVAMPTDVKNQATILAGEGYFISAFGGNDTDGYMLVGMRVKGDSLPRSIAYGSGTSSVNTAPFTVVAWFAETYGGGMIYEQ